MMSLKIAGEIDVTFLVDKEKFTERCLVSPHIEDPLLSVSRLARNKIIWHFADEYL